LKPKRPFIPPEKADTLRHEIISLLEGKTLSAKEISAGAGIPEKEVAGHLEHIQAKKRELHLIIIPASCRKCGFVFAKRERLNKPGKCPVCRGELISGPLFSISRTGSH
jgi:predicted Zn-ribbon and HTH transcriptional regulator